jgi:2-polyprenyl-3-methyl-5-hydroxy-6-metoxy-1,4-benzoquinol methylase
MQRNGPEYYDHFNADLMAAIPPAAGTVLEIGCGAGRLGSVYKERNPASRYIGAELDASAAAIAAGRLDLVLCGPIEALDLGFLNGQTDCIVYGDVLEHLIDPWAVLKRHVPLLSPRGKMVASIPNVQNWSIIVDLLRGDWTYRDFGLMDRTHIRFFTQNSIATMFEGAGMVVEKVGAVVVEQPSATAVAEGLRSVLEKLGVEFDAFHQRTSVFQYLITAAKAA